MLAQAADPATGSFYVQLAQLGVGAIALWWLAQYLVPKMFGELRQQQVECAAERKVLTDQIKADNERLSSGLAAIHDRLAQNGEAMAEGISAAASAARQATKTAANAAKAAAAAAEAARVAAVAAEAARART